LFISPLSIEFIRIPTLPRQRQAGRDRTPMHGPHPATGVPGYRLHHTVVASGKAPWPGSKSALRMAARRCRAKPLASTYMFVWGVKKLRLGNLRCMKY
jgi:hypothetical protein